MTEENIYPKKPYQVGVANTVTMTNRSKDKILPVRHNTPGNIILVHGVNDIGTSYAAVERGLCEGLATRLSGELTPASYKLPTADDGKRLMDDPDAVFFKRTIDTETLSPVIPFYWGYREEKDRVQLNAKLSRGQALDRNGNRLDRDFSKGGGPFANATTTLPDMWNKGKWGVARALDRAQHDATHPVLNNPGRMYMILAARRLAALICMIRDYDKDETVSIVAHSQGCLISLLAQAFLLDPSIKKEQPNARPADTLILTHPPYSLIDEIAPSVRIVDRFSDEDPAMVGRYSSIDGIQTADARLRTLSNIVRGVWSSKHTAPVLSELSDSKKHCGAVGKQWRAEADRDNRGKVYLYFCPEDMTVALENVLGIGWQGVPTFQRVAANNKRREALYKPLAELGEGFRQRVFTAKKRPDPVSGKPVMLGPADSPFYFVLRQPGEKDYVHTEVSDTWMSKMFVRGHLDATRVPRLGRQEVEMRNQGIRTINGEALKVPVEASMHEGALHDAKGRQGASERVDPIDASIALTSNYGLINVWQCMEHRVEADRVQVTRATVSPFPSVYGGAAMPVNDLAAAVQAILNSDKQPEACCEVLEAYACSSSLFSYTATSPPKILIKRTETWNEARLRWQQQIVPRSFHGAIFGGQANHRNVTAYDVAIGGGKASSDRPFYAYLCQVADWRLQNNEAVDRAGIRKWSFFLRKHDTYFSVEKDWRKKLIEGNRDYYSTGLLPKLPVLPDGLPISVVCELKS
ncbi:DUF3274 domain-containing protein [Duganella sp. sic0402]|uniref:T6SS effector phospholipase Tle3 domain-containing protein n=1 Tax=Duganella sp. sic0402 TaxID=2854786 RepID=UPI001C489DBA|nr:DUF3274 domain-containing protein [Duganella sp. sic0402]MBV7539264.1 DUF3274 domain-containing protein [Duganella sp. sic0402]